MSKDSLKAVKVITPKFRVSFPKVFKAEPYEDNPPMFSITMLFPKTTDISKLKKAAETAMVERFGPKPKWPKGYKWPFSDGDEKADLEGYKGKIVVKASSKEDKKPQVVDEETNPILDQSEFYAGCFARANILAAAFDKGGGKGVKFVLLDVQKLGDGKPFSGKKDASEVFGNAEIEDSDFSDEDLQAEIEDENDDMDLSELD